MSGSVKRYQKFIQYIEQIGFILYIHNTHIKYNIIKDIPAQTSLQLHRDLRTLCIQWFCRPTFSTE